MSRSRGRRANGSTMVAAGIFLSRIAGLVREMATGAFIGTGAALDAFRAALKIPNLLQNLLGEGALSASFIPVYSDLLEKGDRMAARRLAGAVVGLLTAIAAATALVGIVLADPLTRLIAPGLAEETHELTVTLVRIMFPGTAVLVLSAWCLGVLNAHRRFFLSYVAPVVWNAVLIAVLIGVGLSDATGAGAVEALAWGVLVGGVLQFLVQVPGVMGVAPGIRPGFGVGDGHVRAVLGRFAPAVLGRGVVQLSAFVDVWLASALAIGALSVIGFAQILYILPVSLFAMSTAAAELPELSRVAEDRQAVVDRTVRGARRILFFLLFTAVAYIAVGEPLVGALLERGEFTGDDTIAVWLVLATMALGLPAVGTSRMLQNTLYALGDARGPARIAVIRVFVTAGAGLALMFPFDHLVVRGGAVDGDLSFGRLDAAIREAPTGVHLGAVGLALGLSASAWTELVLLDRLARRSVPELPPARSLLWPMAVPAALAFLAGAAANTVLDPLPLLVAAPLALGFSGFVYVVACFRHGVTEADLILRPVRRALWRR